MTSGVFERARRVWDLPSNPVADVVRKPERYSNDLDFYSAEEVMQLVRAAASEQDAAIFLSAAFTGLRRGELVALRWRDVLFEREAIRVRASYSYGALTTPKSDRARTVPMVTAVAERLDSTARARGQHRPRRSRVLIARLPKQWRRSWNLNVEHPRSSASSRTRKPSSPVNAASSSMGQPCANWRRPALRSAAL
jgi:integrase